MDHYYTVVPVTKIERKNGKIVNTLGGPWVMNSGMRRE